MYGKMQESGLTEIIPLICTSALWGQYPSFVHPELGSQQLAYLHPEFPQGSPSRVAIVA